MVEFFAKALRRDQQALRQQRGDAAGLAASLRAGRGRPPPN
jgi:hypothetical protein